eukprot:scaffold845_cov364-Prasinococcus_capsulatus_cf.AAC.18
MSVDLFSTCELQNLVAMSTEQPRRACGFGLEGRLLFQLRHTGKLPSIGGTTANSPAQPSPSCGPASRPRRVGPSGSPVISSITTISLPRVGVLKADAACGCTTLPARNPPPISVPPQYSMIGLYPAQDESHMYVSGLEASPLELKHL